jgi:hypothetical protein
MINDLTIYNAFQKIASRDSRSFSSPANWRDLGRHGADRRWADNNRSYSRSGHHCFFAIQRPITFQVRKMTMSNPVRCDPFEPIRRKRPWLDNYDFEIRVEEGRITLTVDMLDVIDREMTKYPEARMTIRQIQEKLGGLRFYRRLSGDAPDTLQEAILACYERTEELSWITCERCGARGLLRVTPGHLAVKCDLHASDSGQILHRTRSD